MTKAKSIVKFLESNFPLAKAEEWDNVGKQYGNEKNIVTNIMVALDLTSGVLDDAINKKCNFIITHHPFLFEKTIEEDFSKYPYKKELHDRMMNSEIILVSHHTNFDSSKEGTAFQLMESLNIDAWKKISESEYGVIFDTNLSVHEMCGVLQRKLHLTNFQTNISKLHKTKSTRMAFLPGSGSVEDIIKAKNDGAAIIFTSDIKWSTWLLAEEEGIILVQLSHSIENVFIYKIINILNKKFPKINIYANFIKDFTEYLEVQ